jgi:hypothetical protein
VKEATTREDGSVSPRETGRLALSAWSVVAAFGTYFCMYGFRKPFTAAGYSGEALWGIDCKTVLIIAQVLGYTLSKFLAIKVVAEWPPGRRAALLLALIGTAHLALLLFGLTPAPFNALWLFVNGVPLGMVFGLVLGFLEGRLHTEALAAGLCASFIVADGVTKSVGAALLATGVGEYWMPFVAGLLFALPLLVFVWMLTRIPAPSPHDVAARSERAPMSRQERRQFFRRYATGLTLLVAVFVLVTVLRSVRADFAPEIWKGLGVKVQSDVYARSEIVVAFGVVVLNGSAVFIRDNRKAFFAALALAGGGAALVGLALVGLKAGVLSPFAFMVLHGLGLYLPYIAVHTTLFERLIAMTRDRGNVGYLLYVADAFGYLGYVMVLLARNAVGRTENFLPFFVLLSWAIAVACIVLLIPCWLSFATHPATRPAILPASGPVAEAEGGA